MQSKQDETDRAYVQSLLSSAQQRGFYGTLTLRLEGGDLKRVEKNESLVPPRVSADSAPVRQ